MCLPVTLCSLGGCLFQIELKLNFIFVSNTQHPTPSHPCSTHLFLTRYHVNPVTPLLLAFYPSPPLLCPPFLVLPSVSLSLLSLLSVLLQPSDFSVSLKAAGKNKHFKVQLCEGVYCIGQRRFNNMDQLVEHYKKAPIFTSEQGDKLYLVKPLL